MTVHWFVNAVPRRLAARYVAAGKVPDVNTIEAGRVLALLVRQPGDDAFQAAEAAGDFVSCARGAARQPRFQSGTMLAR
jgi:hypothetical protein